MNLKELLQWYRGCYSHSYFGHCSYCGNFIVDRAPFLVPDLNGNSGNSYYYCCSLECALRKVRQVDSDWVFDVLQRLRKDNC